ncbi:MAG: transcription/translation regulatory transformer protein RfaH [Kangiella sp.]|nr:MAG: transcription/translation regulatory transformer protein RfaH [Kangiella sp.]PHS19892.1 MAG: transcription/translation regulatory transformer protein RfaH [Kangiella sp.]
MEITDTNSLEPSNISSQEWFLAATKPNQEFRAVENLKNQNIHAFCPKLKVEKVSNRKKRVIEEAIFKGYIFIQISSNDPCWHKVRSTRGIRDWIRFSGNVAKIPTKLVLELINAKESKETVILNNMNEGDSVRILTGPFEGLEGIFQKNDGDVRAIILLNFLGKSNRISIEQSQLSHE